MGANPPQIVRLNRQDDVVVALLDLAPGMEIEGEGATCINLVPAGHKMAARDINCGLVVEGEITIEQTGQIIFQNILDTASGQKSKSEAFGFGESEFVPWHMGVVT